MTESEKLALEPIDVKAITPKRFAKDRKKKRIIDYKVYEHSLSERTLKELTLLHAVSHSENISWFHTLLVSEFERRGYPHYSKEKKELKSKSLSWRLPRDMEIRDIDIQYVVGLTDKGLLEVWKWMTKQKFEEDIYNSGIFVGTEMFKRGLWMKYKGKNKLAREIADKVQEYGGSGEPLAEDGFITLEQVLKSLPSAITIEGQPWRAYLAGRLVNEGKISGEQDIDLIIKGNPNPRVITAIKNMMPSWLEDKIHIIFDESGPKIGNAIPIYKSGFFRTSDKEQVKGYGSFRELSEGHIKPITRFRFLKQKSGWQKNEFFEYETFYKNWGSKNLDRGIFASKKYDGRAFSLQKKGNEIAIITEDQQRDRSNVLPNVVKELRKIPHDFILHTEAVGYNCKGKEIKSAFIKENSCEEIPREDTAFLTIGGISLEQENSVIFHAHDILYFDKDVHNLPYKDRFDLLKDFINKYRFLNVVKSSIEIKTPRDLAKSVYGLRRLRGSEGVFFRTADATYPIKRSGTNRSPLLAKIKNLKTIDVMVWNRIAKKETKTGKELNQWMYDCVYLVPCDTKEVDRIIKYNNKCYAPIGRSYATAEKNERGDIIEILTGRIRYYKHKYTWMFPKYRGRRKDKNEPDTLDTVKKLSKVGTSVSLSTQGETIKLKICPYHKESWCKGREIFGMPRAHLLSDIRKEYLKFPIICKLANIYKCHYLKGYYYGEESIYRSDKDEHKTKTT